MHITDECMNCGACVDECPNNSIYNAGEGYTCKGATYPAVSDEHTYIAPPMCDNCGTCKDSCAVGAIQEN